MPIRLGDWPRYDYMFLGIVRDNNDSEKLGRVKVEIFGFFEGWVPPLGQALGNGAAIHVVPDIGCVVAVWFEHGHTSSPVYTIGPSNNVDLPAYLTSASEPHKIASFDYANFTVKIDGRDEAKGLTISDNSSGTQIKLIGGASPSVLISGGNRPVSVESTASVSVTAPTVTLGSSSGAQKLLTEAYHALFASHTHPDPLSGMTGPPVYTPVTPPMTTNTKAT